MIYGYKRKQSTQLIFITFSFTFSLQLYPPADMTVTPKYQHNINRKLTSPFVKFQITTLSFPQCSNLVASLHIVTSCPCQ